MKELTRREYTPGVWHTGRGWSSNRRRYIKKPLGHEGGNVALVRAQVWQVVRDEEGNSIVLLRDDAGRILPIAIGSCEADAIWVCLAPERATPYLRRPWTHDLMQSILDRLGARLESVVVDDLDNGTFYATLHVMYRGNEVLVDARPSDAIALLMRTGAPLSVSEEVMREAGLRPVTDDEDNDLAPPEDPTG
jgi:uncharacterized protein